jgi:hypothetical protein
VCNLEEAIGAPSLFRLIRNLDWLQPWLLYICIYYNKYNVIIDYGNGLGNFFFPSATNS